LNVSRLEGYLVGYLHAHNKTTYLSEGHEGGRRYGLVGFGSALIASVSRNLTKRSGQKSGQKSGHFSISIKPRSRSSPNLHHGFDFGCPGDDSPDGAKLPHFFCLDVADGDQLLQFGRLEVDFEATEELGRISVPERREESMGILRGVSKGVEHALRLPALWAGHP
jgi:hypothetical protein